MRTLSRNVRWSLWMTLIGAVAAVTVYGVTASVGWALVALVASGMVLNAVAHPANWRREG